MCTDNFTKNLRQGRYLRQERPTPAGWLAMLLMGCLLWGLGCTAAPPPPQPADITYTSDDHTQTVIDLLANESESNPYKKFTDNFSGLVVPPSLFALDPFVLGFSTESPNPTILLLEAHWVQSYGRAGWLFELERSQLFKKDDLVPAVAEAFTVAQSDASGRPVQALVAVPTSIRGNILFLSPGPAGALGLTPPRHWDELKAICQKILPREKYLKYGLLMHSSQFVDDFYPIF